MNCELGAGEKSRRARRTLAGCVLGLVFCAVAAQVPAEDLDNRIANVSRLIEESSGAKRVEDSGNAEALARREQARKLLQQARTARDSGDAARASALLGEASRSMFDAVRLAGIPDSMTRKDVSDFDDRVRSIEALTAAL